MKKNPVRENPGENNAKSLKPTDPSQRAGEKDFPIVAIGASAGGLDALGLFFKNTPVNTGMAFVIIMHLDPDRTGMMPELIQRSTPMKVVQANDRITVKPDHVYVIPPNRSMSILHGVIHLLDPVERKGLRLPIDIFFRSLAHDSQERSIGIILSGMGSDGTLGVKAIREKNGLVLVQDPADAKFDGMPRSASLAVSPDFLAGAEDLPGKLTDYLKFRPRLIEEKETDYRLKSNIEKIVILIREQTGNDFSMYKKTTLFRRIERRKVIHKIDRIQNYVRFLQKNPEEIDILHKELLIGVTKFYRDSKLWEILKEKALPELFQTLPDGYTLRAWVPGCSTGEEAYSLAIIFSEITGKLKTPRNLRLQIFATDIDQDAIARARKGIFPENIAADVSEERLDTFFTRENNQFRISTAIREMVIFASHNITRDPPFINLDIISCRNLLIYMESELQKKLISLFDYILKINGIMLLGTAETTGNFKDNFTEIDKKLKIFKHTKKNNPAFIDIPYRFHYTVKEVNGEKGNRMKADDGLKSITDQILLQSHAPPSVLVNEAGDILYITGRTGKYLEPVAGKANWNIHAMAKEGLKEQLPDAFRKAVGSIKPVIIERLRISDQKNSDFVNIIVQQIKNPPQARGLILVIFKEIESGGTLPEDQKTSVKSHTSRKVKDLNTRLQRSLEDLQSTREEMQTSQEELKSMNEELQSANEELQSTNEELTTSKEEMQSLNEELQTVNIELQSKVNDFIRSSDDMKNLLNSTQIATLFLDRDLNIRRFTDQLTHLFKFRESDIGRPFTDMVTDLKYPEIETHARNVLKTLSPIETAVKSNDNQWFNVRIMPYRTSDDRIDGLVMTFTDVTTAKSLEKKLQSAEDRLLKKLAEKGSPPSGDSEN